MTLTEFLLARIAEDEATARAATRGPWSFEAAPDGMAPLVIGDDMAVAETVDKPHLSDARHIARHDPDRVLAECESKRRIIEWHRVDDMGRCIDDHHYPAPCPTLQLLALSYADHPDYRADWKP